MVDYGLISHTAQSYKKDLVKFLREIVAIPSLSTKEDKVAKRIVQEMKKADFDEVRIDPMGNVIGRIGSGKTIIALDGHIDNVDIGDPSLWNINPYKGKYENDVIYGRGSADQKGGFAAALFAGKLLKKLKLTGDYTLYVTGTVMEEDCDGLNWQYIVKEDKIRPDCVVITESTSLNIYRGQRGRMEIEVTTRGISCHGSAPERGVNAVYKMVPIIADIERLNTRLKEDKFLGKGTVTISHIRSTSPSLCAVADSCTIHLDRRLTAGETEKLALSQIKNLPGVKKAKAELKVLDYSEKSYTGLVYPTRKYYPMWVLPENSTEVKTAKKTYNGLFRKTPKVDHWVFSTNGISICGMFGIPIIGFGPGEERQAHSPNEHIPAQDLVEAMKFYAAFVLNYGPKRVS